MAHGWLRLGLGLGFHGPLLALGWRTALWWGLGGLLLLVTAMVAVGWLLTGIWPEDKAARVTPRDWEEDL